MLPPRERRTTTGWFAISFILGGFILVSIAMFSRHWLQAENKAYGASVDSIGLWTQCFRSLSVPDDTLRETFFTGCRWIFDPFTDKYDTVRDFVQTPFFVAVQVFFTFGFTLSLVGVALAGVLVLCPGEDFEKAVLKLSYIIGFAAFFCGFIAVIVFGSMGDNRDWMPHWDHNHLSWSFGLAVVGVVSQFVASVLFWVEWRIQRRKDSVRRNHGAFPLETKA